MWQLIFHFEHSTSLFESLNFSQRYKNSQPSDYVILSFEIGLSVRFYFSFFHRDLYWLSRVHFIVNRESSRNVVSLLYSDLFICGSTWFNLLLIYHSSSRRREDERNFQFVARIYAIRWKGEIVEREKEERRKFIAGTIPRENFPSILI